MWLYKKKLNKENPEYLAFIYSGKIMGEPARQFKDFEINKYFFILKSCFIGTCFSIEKKCVFKLLKHKKINLFRLNKKVRTFKRHGGISCLLSLSLRRKRMMLKAQKIIVLSKYKNIF